MVAGRGWWLMVVLMAALIPIEAMAQGRGRGGEGGDRGPRFCRNGEGHPVFGWAWCDARGWGRYPAPGRDGVRARDVDRRYGDAAFEHGYADGYEKGLDDRRDRRAYDPVRHRWYRDGERGYDRRDGSRAQYRNAYRDAFRRGYERGYRDGDRTDRGGGVRLPWPF